MDFIIAHWVEFSILLVVFTYFLRALGLEGRESLKAVSEFLVVFRDEFLLKSQALGASIVNLIMIILTFLLVLFSFTHDMVVESPVFEGHSQNLSTISLILFGLAIFGSPSFIIIFNREIGAFKD